MKKFGAVIVMLGMIVLPAIATGVGDTNGGKQSIRVMLVNHPYGDLLKSKISEFENASGIKVTVEQLQETQLTQQLTTEFATGSSTVDVFMTRPLQDGLLFMKNGWYESLSSYDFSDYPKSTVDIGTKNGTVYIVPLVTEWEVLYYRKDLLKAAGLSVPKNFTELEAAAKAMNKNGVAGFASRGKGSAAVTQMSSYVYNYGGRYIENGRAVFNSPEAIEAIRFYGMMNGTYGPQGITSMSWENIVPVFQAGKVAMWTDASVFFSNLTDPTKSVIPKENIGIAPFPAGPKTNNPFIVVSWGMAIAKTSRNKDAARKFLEWATGKDLAKQGMLKSITMARNSVWKDADVLKKVDPELVASQLPAAQNGYPFDRPFMSSVGAARDLIGEVILESINTKGTSRNLEILAKEKVRAVDALLKTDGEYGN